jgi:hypothetical protein
MEKRLSTEAIPDPSPGGLPAISQSLETSDIIKVTDNEAVPTQTFSLFVQENLNNEESKNA